MSNKFTGDTEIKEQVQHATHTERSIRRHQYSTCFRKTTSVSRIRLFDNWQPHMSVVCGIIQHTVLWRMLETPQPSQWQIAYGARFSIISQHLCHLLEWLLWAKNEINYNIILSFSFLYWVEKILVSSKWNYILIFEYCLDLDLLYLPIVMTYCDH